MASGTEASCQFQGILIHYLEVVFFGYYTSLAVYALLAVLYKFDQKLLKKFDRFFHLIIWLVPIFTTVWGYKGQYFNPWYSYCDMGPHPFYCVDSDSDDVECDRGEDIFESYYIVSLSLCYLSLIIGTLAIVVLVFLLHYKSASTANAREGKVSVIEEARKRKMKLIILQSSVYLFAMYLTDLFRLIGRTSFLHEKQRNPTIDLIGVIIYASNGIIFSSVYWFLRVRKEIYNRSQRLADPYLRISVLGRARQFLTIYKPPPRQDSKSDPVLFSIFDGGHVEKTSKWAEFLTYDDDDDDDNVVDDDYDDDFVVEEKESNHDSAGK